MYFEIGADCLRGMMSPGNIVSGHVVSGADCLQGMLSSGAGFLRGRLFPGRIVSRADCLGAYCLRGALSPGRIVLGHIVSGHIVSGADCLWAPCPPTVNTTHNDSYLILLDVLMFEILTHIESLKISRKTFDIPLRML